MNKNGAGRETRSGETNKGACEIWEKETRGKTREDSRKWRKQSAARNKSDKRRGENERDFEIPGEKKTFFA